MQDSEKTESAVEFVRSLIVRDLGVQPYEPIWKAMQCFTDQRGPEQQDEIWIVQHAPVFTQGQAGKAEHVLAPGDIPVVNVDRGGQVTYHGPGQLVCYLLLDLRRNHIGVRELVTLMENAVVTVLGQYGISSYPKADAPGVYVDGDKICSLGLRVRRGCSFHGLALNVDMDLSPFQRINPCGYQGLQMTQVVAHHPGITVSDVSAALQKYLTAKLGYTHTSFYQHLDHVYV
ncbi:lipoyl(octanoyl) transferase LipB [Pokkaliibacter sp. MBI-7]|uniref:lipoyl(octanoyl) transferase LipB n=1 Tax=Pokkaliibacter sp. MBI-7 TaxID=3040600 RepID=UPI002449EA93|nr:lipoyl(octanoyl) transferase LipB [Pokkaliibacter sp. MBI-7]MDH2431865.1 lipoyl(octanoyl) transferase LipB [Pokkaliibacter sp. MBI-7]